MKKILATTVACDANIPDNWTIIACKRSLIRIPDGGEYAWDIIYTEEIEVKGHGREVH